MRLQIIIPILSVDHLLFFSSDDIIRSFEQNEQLLHNSVLMISLDLMKSSEVRIAGDRSNCQTSEVI